METATGWDTLLSLSHPWAHLASCSERTFGHLFSVLRRRDNGIVARIIQGDRCQTSPDFFRESATVLNFPSYFGHNWDAFNDCINDLEWLPAKHYIFGIMRSHLLLVQDENRLATFADILSDAADAWPIYDADRDWTKTWITAEDGTTQWAQRPVASFHAVLHCEPANEMPTRERFQKGGLSLAPFHISPEFAAQ
ncbi:MAG: barstar family protein [Thermomicrobiales bacterium]